MGFSQILQGFLGMLTGDFYLLNCLSLFSNVYLCAAFYKTRTQDLNKKISWELSLYRLTPFRFQKMQR